MVIDVPVTAISNATGFDGYQVIVMPTENSAIEEEPTFPTEAKEREEQKRKADPKWKPKRQKNIVQDHYDYLCDTHNVQTSKGRHDYYDLI